MVTLHLLTILVGALLIGCETVPLEGPDVSEKLTYDICQNSQPLVFDSSNGPVSFILQSPNYNNGKYPNNLDCSFTIRAEVSASLRLHFETFQLEEERTCKYDSLCLRGVLVCEVMEGTDQSFTIPRYNTFTFVFHSDSTIAFRGFQIHVEITEALYISRRTYFDKCDPKSDYSSTWYSPTPYTTVETEQNLNPRTNLPRLISNDYPTAQQRETSFSTSYYEDKGGSNPTSDNNEDYDTTQPWDTTYSSHSTYNADSTTKPLSPNNDDYDTTWLWDTTYSSPSAYYDDSTTQPLSAIKDDYDTTWLWDKIYSSGSVDYDDSMTQPLSPIKDDYDTTWLWDSTYSSDSTYYDDSTTKRASAIKDDYDTTWLWDTTYSSDSTDYDDGTTHPLSAIKDDYDTTWLWDTTYSSDSTYYDDSTTERASAIKDDYDTTWLWDTTYSSHSSRYDDGTTHPPSAIKDDYDTTWLWDTTYSSDSTDYDDGTTHPPSAIKDDYDTTWLWDTTYSSDSTYYHDSTTHPPSAIKDDYDTTWLWDTTYSSDSAYYDDSTIQPPSGIKDDYDTTQPWDTTYSTYSAYYDDRNRKLISDISDDYDETYPWDTPYGTSFSVVKSANKPSSSINDDYDITRGWDTTHSTNNHKSTSKPNPNGHRKTASLNEAHGPEQETTSSWTLTPFTEWAKRDRSSWYPTQAPNGNDMKTPWWDTTAKSGLNRLWDKTSTTMKSSDPEDKTPRNSYHIPFTNWSKINKFWWYPATAPHPNETNKPRWDGASDSGSNRVWDAKSTTIKVPEKTSDSEEKITVDRINTPVLYAILKPSRNEKNIFSDTKTKAKKEHERNAGVKEENKYLWYTTLVPHLNKIIPAGSATASKPGVNARNWLWKGESSSLKNHAEAIDPEEKATRSLYNIPLSDIKEKSRHWLNPIIKSDVDGQ